MGKRTAETGILTPPESQPSTPEGDRSPGPLTRRPSKRARVEGGDFITLREETSELEKTEHHFPSLTSFINRLNTACQAKWETRDTPYNQVVALLVHWAEDDLGVTREIGALGTVFRDDYKFDVNTLAIPSSKRGYLNLGNKIQDILREYDIEGNLFILYYGGHARRDEGQSQPTWVSKRQGGLSFNSSSFFHLFNDMDADLLLLLDSCQALPQNFDSTGKGVAAAITATGFEHGPAGIAPGVGSHSFTHALVEVLGRMSIPPDTGAGQRQEPMCDVSLHAFVVEELRASKPSLERTESGELKRDTKGRLKLEPYQRRTPHRYWLSRNKSNRPIRLLPLRGKEKGLCSGPSSKGTSEEKDSHPHCKPVYDTVVPEVLVAIRLEPDALSTLDIDAWTNWALRVPSASNNVTFKANAVTIEGLYRSYSSLIILKMPLETWSLLPRERAMTFIGYVKGQNQAAGINSQVNAAVSRNSLVLAGVEDTSLETDEPGLNHPPTLYTQEGVMGRNVVEPRDESSDTGDRDLETPSHLNGPHQGIPWISASDTMYHEAASAPRSIDRHLPFSYHTDPQDGESSHEEPFPEDQGFLNWATEATARSQVLMEPFSSDWLATSLSRKTGQDSPRPTITKTLTEPHAEQAHSPSFNDPNIRIHFDRGDADDIPSDPAPSAQFMPRIGYPLGSKKHDEDIFSVMKGELEAAKVLHSADSDSKFFIPRGSLRKIITPSRVAQAIERLGCDNGSSDTQKARLVDRIVSPDPGQRCSKLFAVLLRIGMQEQLERLIHVEGVSDQCLPLQWSNGVHGTLPTCRLPHHRHPTIDAWPDDIRSMASQWSYAVQAPYFARNNGGHNHYILESVDVLPFHRTPPTVPSNAPPPRETTDTDIGVFRGGFSDVQQVVIDESHYRFEAGFGEDFGTRDSRLGLRRFAMKQRKYLTSAQLEDELACLSRFQRSDSKHLLARMMLATFEINSEEGKTYSLLFPSPEGDLWSFWKKHHAEEDRIPRAHWMARQIYGLALCLKALHFERERSLYPEWRNSIPLPTKTGGATLMEQLRTTLRYRNGDLKPEDILWFRGENGNEHLAIDDFGLSRSQDPRSRAHSGAPFDDAHPPLEFPCSDVNPPDSPLGVNAVFSFGRLCLIFIIWYLHGWRGVLDGFIKVLREKDPDGGSHFGKFVYIAECPIDDYTTITTTELRVSINRLRKSKLSSPYTLEFLKAIDRMLEPDPTKRMTLSELPGVLAHLVSISRRKHV